MKQKKKLQKRTNGNDRAKNKVTIFYFFKLLESSILEWR